MEYIVKEQIERYSLERDSLINELISLNENLPFYDKKIALLQNQIDKIDYKITDLVLTVERHKVFEINNKI